MTRGQLFALLQFLHPRHPIVHGGLHLFGAHVLRVGPAAEQQQIIVRWFLRHNRLMRWFRCVAPFNSGERSSSMNACPAWLGLCHAAGPPWSRRGLGLRSWLRRFELPASFALSPTAKLPLRRL